MTKNKYTALLDCDGVMADFIGSLQAIHPDVPTPTEWDFISSLPPALYADVIRTLNTEEFWVDMRPLMTRECFARMRDNHLGLRVVTAPWTSLGDRWHVIRREWILKHYDVPAWNVIITSKKYEVRGVLYDDKPDNIRDHLAHGQLAYLVDQPWNRGNGLPRTFLADEARYHYGEENG